MATLLSIDPGVELLNLMRRLVVVTAKINSTGSAPPRGVGTFLSCGLAFCASPVVGKVKTTGNKRAMTAERLNRKANMFPP
jgi:hypothetical protein